jgi:hypothetical protein
LQTAARGRRRGPARVVRLQASGGDHTTEQLRSGTPNDWLASYEVQLVWRLARGTLSIDAVERLARCARRQRAAAFEVFARACAMRSDSRALAGALVDRRLDRRPAAKMLARLNTRLANPMPCNSRPGPRLDHVTTGIDQHGCYRR